MYHLFDARNVQYDDFKSMIKDDKYSDKTKKYFRKNWKENFVMNEIQQY